MNDLEKLNSVAKAKRSQLPIENNFNINDLSLHIQLYADSMKEVEFFLLNHNIAYETRDRKSRTKDPMQDKKMIPILTLEGSMGPIELFIYHIDDLKINKTKASIEETEKLLNG